MYINFDKEETYQKMEKNKIYFGDNLEVMRDMEEESIDLIATDPPFNSGRDYNIFLPKSEAQKKAFTDIWEWDDTAIEARTEIEELAKKPGGGSMRF